MTIMFKNQCAIIAQTADGVSVGRCWHTLENDVCPTHGDVSKVMEIYRLTGMCTLEKNKDKE